ncbi:MAG: molybdate ABC transporter substrate-binding protein [Butyricicoccus sp.]
MKLFRTLAASLALSCMLAGCGASSSSPSASSSAGAASSSAESEPVELTVFAAASMTETLTEIQALYAEEAPNVTLVYNFDSSGTLKTQIEQGAVCDLFLSAGQKQMNQLDIDADASVNTDGLDFVDGSTRCDLLENKVVMIVPEGSDKGITSFEDAGTDKVSLIALGNSDVPVGQYSEQIFTSLGLWDSLNADSKISFGTNVKEVLTQVEQAAVDCGVVYQTDAAASSGVEVVAEAPEGSCAPAIYPVAVLKTSEHPDEARAFLEFLKTDACAEIFTQAGFTVK